MNGLLNAARLAALALFLALPFSGLALAIVGLACIRSARAERERKLVEFRALTREQQLDEILGPDWRTAKIEDVRLERLM